MKVRKLRSAIRKHERVMFLWYMQTGQIMCYYATKVQQMACFRFYKNLERHLQPNSIYMKEWEYLQREKP